ncbi:two-component regulator propeller domain-containing protein [Marinilabiliaceae bacterium ANBcel2]|nr:two-component regulator propeller domain-containing protein [Marinilabiliaceae bacterium ANBcel2]
MHRISIGLPLLLLLLFLSAGMKGIGVSERFSTAEGLSSNLINVIFQDSRGFLWIGTEDGLNRYDGVSFKTFRAKHPFDRGLSGNQIVAIEEDLHGNLWIGTRSKGISVYLWKSGEFIQFRFDPDKLESLPEENAYGFYMSPTGDIYIKTENYLSRYLPEKNHFVSYGHFTNFFKQIYSFGYPVKKETDSTYIVGTKDGVNRFNLEQRVFERLYPFDDAEGIYRDAVYDIVDISDGEYLIGGRSGLYSFNDSLGFRDISLLDKSDRNVTINSICLTGNNNVYLGTNMGLYQFDSDIKGYFRVKNGTSQNSDILTYEITTLFEDKSGIIWAGTRFNGLFKIESLPNWFSFFGEADNESSPLYSFNTRSVYYDFDHNRILFGTENSGLYAIDSNTKRSLHFITDNTSYNNLDDGVYSIFKDFNKDLIWLGTNSGVKVLNSYYGNVDNYFQEDGSRYKNFLNNNVIYDIERDSEGTLWFATHFGLFSYFDGDISGYFYSENDNALPSNKVHCLALSYNNVLWIGGANGLAYYDRSLNQIKPFSLFENKNNPDSEILSLTFDDDEVLWIGTRSGLITVEEDKKGKFVIDYVDGWDNVSISSVVTDDRGAVWISSGDRIAMFSSDGERRIFDHNDGLPKQFFNINSVFKDKKGALYFGGVEGVCKIFPDSIRYNPNTPKIAATSITVCRRGECEDILKGSPDTISIEYSPGTVINFSLAALEFSRPLQNRFKVYLDGYDDRWREIKAVDDISYANLMPGEYTLRAVAANNDMVWSDQEYHLHVIVNTPLWMSNYAYIFYILILLFIIQMIVNYRIRHYKKANKTLSEKNSDKTRIENQRKDLSLINQRLTDSIHYAMRIQSAMLPDELVMQKTFPHSFVYFRPKELVSGDFFWVHEEGSKLFIAAVDCTGHGVSGAFMSIIGMDLLKSIVIVQKEHNPGIILGKLSNELNSTLVGNSRGESVTSETVKDGMDISLCVIDRESCTMDFAGAVNGLYLIRDNELIVYRGDRLPIGHLNSDGSSDYVTIPIDLQKEDMIYLFSDGYVDQFGGDEGKKFKYRRFRHLLLNIHIFSPDDQKAVLHQKFEEWKSDHEQVDDVMVIGFNPLYGG